MTILGTVITARDVQVGDRIVLPSLGPRTVLEVSEYLEDTGPDPGPRIRIIYGLGRGHAFENSASRGKRPSSFAQPEAGLRPLKPDEPMQIERAAGERVAIARRAEEAIGAF